MKALLLLVMSQQISLTEHLYPSSHIRWSPDQNLLAYTGYVTKKESPRAHRLIIARWQGKTFQQLGSIHPAFQKDEDDYQTIRHDHFLDWGPNGQLLHVHYEDKSVQRNLDLTQITGSEFETKQHYEIPAKQWASIVVSRLIFGGRILLMVSSSGSKNRLQYADLTQTSYQPHPIQLRNTIHPIPSITVKTLADRERVLISGRVDGHYKLYSFDLHEPQELDKPILAHRVTKSPHTLNEHFPKLNNSGNMALFYGVEDNQEHSSLYVATLGSGTIRQVDQLIGTTKQQPTLQGLIPNNAESVYCWTAEGTHVFYIARSDRYKNPIMWRSALTETDQRMIKSGKQVPTHIDVSPKTGTLAAMVFQTKNGLPSARLTQLASPLKLPMPSIHIKLPQGIAKADLKIGGKDAKHYTSSLKGKHLTLEPKTPKLTLKAGRPLALSLAIKSLELNLPLKASQTSHDLGYLRGDRTITLDTSHYKLPTWENNRLQLNRIPITIKQIRHLLDLPGKFKRVTEYRYQLKIPAEHKQIQLEPQVLQNTRLTFPGEMQSVPTTLRLTAKELVLMVKPQPRSLKITYRARSKTEQTQVRRFLKQIKRRYTGIIQGLSIVGDTSLQFPLLENAAQLEAMIQELARHSKGMLNSELPIPRKQHYYLVELQYLATE